MAAIFTFSKSLIESLAKVGVHVWALTIGRITSLKFRFQAGNYQWQKAAFDTQRTDSPVISLPHSRLSLISPTCPKRTWQPLKSERSTIN
jgi:short-subunit dehydrogenase